MTEKTTTHLYGRRVAARRAIAEALVKPEHAERRRAAGLLDDDLLFIAAKGKEAADHDRRQREDLADQRRKQQETLRNRDSFEAEQEALRNRLPAVMADLAANPSTAGDAGWLAVVSFDRFRIRVTLPSGGSAGGTPATPVEPSRERVVRNDLLSRAQSLHQFTTAILDPARAPIIERLAARGMDRDRIGRLAETANDLVDKLGDKAVLKVVEATALESEAVTQQKSRWDACRRMIRAAARDNADLEPLWAAC